MPIMAKSNDEYAEVKAIKTPDGTEIDYVLSKVDNTYKRTYTAIRELEDAPPLEFKSIKPDANLTDYRIYGQTSRNLFDENVKNGNYKNDAYYPRVKWMSPMPIAFGDTITINSDPDVIDVGFIVVNNDGYNQILNNQNLFNSNVLLDTGWQTVPFVYTSEYTGYLAMLFKSAGTSSGTLTTDTMPDVMLNLGSTPLPYEPYGESVGDLVTSGEHAGEYKVLVTVSNDTDTLTTPIYLPEQIKKVGDEAEYIDYGEQKFHRISGADLDVTLPALPTVTGTNVLSVGTEVQPSDMYIKGNFKMIAGGGE